jgi:prevent-host-death family protein
VDIYDAQTHLSELVQRAAAGEVIVIARNGKPAARLVGLAAPPAPRLQRDRLSTHCRRSPVDGSSSGQKSERYGSAAARSSTYIR